MTIVTDFVERLRALVFRAREDRELDEELRFHTEMEADRLRRSGVDTGEARRRSLVALGGIERVKEDVRDARGTRTAEDIAGDVRFALRTLSRNKGFAIAATLTLALGIGGTTAVFSAVDAVLLQPLPYQESGQLVRLYQAHEKRRADRGFVTPVHFLEFRARMSSVEAMAALMTYSESGADIGSGESVERIRTLPISSDYFDVMRAHPAIGRGFDRADEDGTGARVVVLSHALWMRRYRGDKSVVGTSLTMNGQAYTISGVMPDGFADPIVRGVEAWMPADLSEGRDAAGNISNHYVSVVARLRRGVSLAQAQAELDRINAAIVQQYPRIKGSLARLDPLKEDVVGDSSLALELMLGAVALVLILVCVNVANLMLVRGSDRAREFALRSALGAERGRLVRQMLVESVTLAAAGVLAGLGVARLAMSGIVAVGKGSIPRLAELHLEPRLLLFSIVVATICAIGTGLAPALRAARTQPGDVLREQSRTSTGGSKQLRLRDWLVVSQVALAFVLLAGAGLLTASLQRIRQVDLGFDPSKVLTFEIHLPDARYDSTARVRFHQEFDARLARLPGVVSVGGVSKLPGTGQFHEWGTNATSGPLGHDDKRGNIGAQHRVVTGDYFKAVGIPVLEGRTFDARDDARAPSRSVISKLTAERLFPGISAVGQTIDHGHGPSEIIGVVGDVSVGAEGDPDAHVYHPHSQYGGERNWSLTQVVRYSGTQSTIVAAARRSLAELDPQLVLHRPIAFTDEIGRGEAQRTFTLQLLTSFALVALALAALGLFGVLSYGVRLRSREFGIRMALGASGGSIRAMVLRQGLGLALTGTVIGLAGALAVGRVMRSMVFGISPVDPIVLSAAAVFMLSVAAAAAYLPARRTTKVEVRETLQ